ncbi:MAG: DUF4097 family beta strand repeat-containing protein [Flagellimonas sp.]
MRTLNTLLALFLLSNFTQAQTIYKRSLSGVKKVKIETATSVKVIEGPTDELIVQVYANCTECKTLPEEDYRYNLSNIEEQEEIKGLKPFYPGEVDNTGVGLHVEKEGGTLVVKDLKSFFQRKPLLVKLPKDIAVSIDSGIRGSVIIDQRSSELDITTDDGNIILNSTTGPITCVSVSGEINLTLDKVNQESPIAITNWGGKTILNLPPTIKADFYLYSYAKDIFTDFELVSKPLKTKGQNSKFKVVSQSNGGGVNITVYSTSGNIFIKRKSQQNH